MAKSSNWNDDLIKQLIDLYNQDKYSTKQIGEMLGFSKNAIVGKIHRLELNKSKKDNAVVNEDIEDKVAEKETKNAAMENKEGLYKLEEININMCVWPFGEEDYFTFCGNKVLLGKPYCQEHFEKAYLKFNKRTASKG